MTAEGFRKKNKGFYEERVKDTLSLFFLWGDWYLKESDFQAKLIKELSIRFPGSIVTKLDSSCIQGIPDLLILYNDKWAVLECKRSPDAGIRPNQEYYIRRMNDMSFARFINPENKEEVLNELQQSFFT